MVRNKWPLDKKMCSNHVAKKRLMERLFELFPTDWVEDS
jgi:hypothetical protein